MPPPPVPAPRVASPAQEPAQRSLSSILSAPHAGDGKVARAPTPDTESAAALFAQKRELEEMKIKMRLLETRRAEDQDRIKSLESKVGEADALRAARVKLQGV